MNKYQLYTLGGALLAATSLSGCAAKPDDHTSQRYFDQACTFASGAIAVGAPFLQRLPLGSDRRKAADSAIAVVQEACKTPLDVHDAAAVTQRIWDAAGRVLEVVASVKQS